MPKNWRKKGTILLGYTSCKSASPRNWTWLPHHSFPHERVSASCAKSCILWWALWATVSEGTVCTWQQTQLLSLYSDVCHNFLATSVVFIQEQWTLCNSWLLSNHGQCILIINSKVVFCVMKLKIRMFKFLNVHYAVTLPGSPLPAALPAWAPLQHCMWLYHLGSFRGRSLKKDIINLRMVQPTPLRSHSTTGLYHNWRTNLSGLAPLGWTVA